MSGRYEHPAGLIDIVCPKCGRRATFRLRAAGKPRKPPRFRPGAWQSAGPDWGVCQCDHCVSRFDHALQWPHDAFWRTSVRGYDLWAHSRAEVGALIRYVASADRDLAAESEHDYFLRKIPRALLAAKARDEVVKRLTKLLEEKTLSA